MGNNGIVRFDILGLKCDLLSGPDIIDGAEWELDSAKPITVGMGNSFTIEGVEVNWKLEGSVKCCCPTWFLSRRRRKKEKIIYKVYEKPEYIPYDDQGMVGVAHGAGPGIVPTPTTIAEGIADVIGAVIQAPIAVSKEHAEELANLVASTKPTSTDYGHWPDDPCN